MAHPIAMIPYINMAPYRELRAPRGCRFVSMVPSESVRALAERQVWAAAVPVGALPILNDAVTPLGPFGIGAGNACLSVLFFSDLPLDHMRNDDAIRLTRESTTSVRLLRLLLNETLRPRSERPPTPPTGELVIGDRALVAWYERQMAVPATAADCNRRGRRYVTDLAAEWYRRYRQPFVFARWVVRTDAPDTCKGALQEWLDRFRRQESECVARAVPKAARRTGLPETLIRRYFSLLRRCFDSEDLAGQERFLAALKPLRLAQSDSRPLRTAASAA